MSILISFRRSFSSKRFEISYNLLKVKRNSPPEEIRQAYLKSIKIYHPDNLETGNSRRFLRLKEAYDRIKDAPLRTEQENYRKACDIDELSLTSHLRQRSSTKLKKGYNNRVGFYHSVYAHSGLFRKFLRLLLFFSRVKSNSLGAKASVYEDKY